MYQCQEMTQHTCLVACTLWYLQNWQNNNHFSKTYYAIPLFNISTFPRSWKISVQDLPSHRDIKHMMLLEKRRLSDIFTGKNCIDLLLNFWQEPAASSFHALARQKQGAQVWIQQEQGQRVTALCKPINHEPNSPLAGWDWGIGGCHQQGTNTQPPRLSPRLPPRHSPSTAAFPPGHTCLFQWEFQVQLISQSSKQCPGTEGFTRVRTMPRWCPARSQLITTRAQGFFLLTPRANHLPK